MLPNHIRKTVDYLKQKSAALMQMATELEKRAETPELDAAPELTTAPIVTVPPRRKPGWKVYRSGLLQDHGLTGS